MEEAIDAEIIKATQVSLGKYVKRPPLSDKLLKKPPFRFLHDIITSVLKSTGFFRGLFDEEELISDNVKDRESKIVFLNKAISVLEITTRKSLSVKPTKVVAGQEPEKTNELLQCLAFALDNKLSSDEAVKQYKGSGSSNKSNVKKSNNVNKHTKQVTDTKKLSSTSTDNLNKNQRNVSKTRGKEISVKKDSPPKNSQQRNKILINKTLNKEKQTHKDSVNKVSNITSIENVAQDSIDSDVNINDTAEIAVDNLNSVQLKSDTAEPKIITEDLNRLIQNNDPPVNISLESKESEKISIDDSFGNKREINNDFEDIKSLNDNDGSTSTDLLKKISSAPPEPTLDHVNGNTISHKQNDIKSDTENKPTETTPVVEQVKRVQRPNSVRPSSSRPGAPRLREKHENLLTSTDNLVVGKVIIIAENTTQEEEEDTSIVIVENENTSNAQPQEDQLNASDRHGHLVQQILDAQKEFSDEAKKNNIEWKFSAQKARDVLNQDIEKLRFNVQALSRVANPLGKLLDHVQEDVEVMRQELQQWTKTYEDATKKLLKQKTANEESLYPLFSKVKQLETDISEKREKINDLKIIIHKNAFRIDKLLASGNVQ